MPDSSPVSQAQSTRLSPYHLTLTPARLGVWGRSGRTATGGAAR